MDTARGVSGLTALTRSRWRSASCTGRSHRLQRIVVAAAIHNAVHTARSTRLCTKCSPTVIWWKNASASAR
jgi:hypothetical protein